MTIQSEMKKAGLTPKRVGSRTALGGKEVKDFKYNPGGTGGYEVKYGEKLRTLLSDDDEEYSSPGEVFSQMKRAGLAPQLTKGKALYGGQEVTGFDPSEEDAGYEIAYRKKEKRPQTLLSSDEDL